jgi:hypothetical protein
MADLQGKENMAAVWPTDSIIHPWSIQMQFLKKLVRFPVATAFIGAAGAQELGLAVPSVSDAAAGNVSGNGPQSLPLKQFGSLLSENIKWQSFPAFPPEARLAVVVGDPSKAGPYVVRVKLPAGVQLMPHTHPEDRIYTVMSGVFYLGIPRHHRDRSGGASAAAWALTRSGFPMQAAQAISVRTGRVL